MFAVTSSSPVRAQEVTPRTQASLQVRARAGCGSVSELSERVATRSDRIAFLPAAQRKVDVAIAQEQETWSADLSFTGAAFPEARRTLQARSCDALLDAVAFVVTVTLDPPHADHDAAGATRNTPQEPGAGTTDASATGSGSQRSPGAAPATSAVGEQQAPSSSDAGPDDVPRLEVPKAISVAPDAGPFADLLADEEPGPPTRFSVAALGRWAHAAAPSELLGLGLAANMQLEHATWSSGLLLGVGYFPERPFQFDAGSASFELVELNVELCPMLWRNSALRIGPCAALVAGRLTARGVDAVRPEQHTRPWGFWGLGLHASLDLLPVQIALGVRGGPTWVRDAFQFAPQVFYRVPDWGAQADLGLGLVLP